MLEHAFAGDAGKRFAGKTGRSESGRDHAQNFAGHARLYQKTPVIHSGKTDWGAAMPLRSHRKFFVLSVFSLLAGSLAWGAENSGSEPKISIEPRATKADRTERSPRANIRVDATLVLIPVTVTDPLNRFVTGLDKENFRLFEDKQEQDLVQFSSEDAPLSIGIVFDASGSMGNKLQKSREAVAQFVKTANPEDEFFLVQFNDRAELVQGFTHDLGEVQSRLAFTQSKGKTALLDAIYLSLHEMKKGEEPAQSPAGDLRRRRQQQPLYGE